MFCYEFSWLWLLWAFLFYKLVDRLIRIPKHSGPSALVNNILITGCDTGFGRLTALRLDKKGFNVFAACLTEKGREDLVKASRSGRISAFIMDVTKRESIEAAYDHVCKNLPAGVGLWGIVNNAGVMPQNVGPLEWLKRKDFHFCCDVNVFGMAEVTRVFLPLLKKTKGRIVCTSSVAGMVGYPTGSPYVVSKFAVEGLCSCIRPELFVYGIKLLIIQPGFHMTNMTEAEQWHKLSVSCWEKLPSDLKEEYPSDYVRKALRGNLGITTWLLSSGRPDGVVDAYEHALLSYFPRGRYLVGYDANCVWWPISNMPEWLIDKFYTFFPGTPVPKSCQ